MSYVKPVIFGCEGKKLTKREVAFFKDHKPFGFILFARNIDNPDQVRSLCDELRNSINNPDAPILIDQEGGRVCRLLPPHWRKPPPLSIFGEIYKSSPEAGLRACYLNHLLISDELRDLGINVDCSPMLDTRVESAHQIVGDRSLSHDPSVVSALGRSAISGLRDGGVQPIIKHIPTHGPATCDSHEHLPIVDWDLEKLRKHFTPFCDNAENAWAMTAHIIYECLDKKNPATHSPLIIESIIRGEIGFNGILVSDDIGMKALSGNMSERATKSLNAGCDVILHCSGNFDEMEEVADALGAADSSLLEKYAAIRNASNAIEFNKDDALEEFEAILEERLDA